MSDDIFKDENEDDNTPAIDPEKDYFSEYVGEGKKYKDNFAVGRALVEKDLFIERLKRENEEARQEIQARLSVEEAMTRISQNSQTPAGQATSHQEDGNGANQEAKGELTPEAIKKLVDEELKARERANAERTAQATAEANLAKVTERLTEAFGPLYKEKVKEAAKEMGVSTQFLTETGAREPNALFRLLNLDQQKSFRDITDPAPARSQVNTTGRVNPGHTERNSAYYDNLKKTDPKRYWLAETQAQMHKDALQLGAARFFVS